MIFEKHLSKQSNKEKEGIIMEEYNTEEIICRLLNETKRRGVTKLIKHMHDIGFFEAPASTRFHGSYYGALAEHSLNVFNTAVDLAIVLMGEKWYEQNFNSIVISSLLHDLGKCGQFDKPLYIENIIESGEKLEAQPFKINDELTTLDHEIVSIIEASRFIKLTEDEQFAIAYHNGLYTNIGKYRLQGKEKILQMIIHWADMWASRVTEKGEDNE